jgi:hypothetical protein
VQRLVFRDLQPHVRRHLVDLPPLAQHDVGVGERRLTLRAVARAMLHHLIRRRHQAQRLAPMPQLPTRLLAALRAQTLRLAFQPVTARRLGTVVAILRQSRFQFLHAFQQPPHLLSQDGVLGFQLGVAFFRRHASMLRLLCKSA